MNWPDSRVLMLALATGTHDQLWSREQPGALSVTRITQGDSVSLRGDVGHTRGHFPADAGRGCPGYPECCPGL